MPPTMNKRSEAAVVFGLTVDTLQCDQEACPKIDSSQPWKETPI
jgi:hypothetical protein